jgi:NOL1/NOP2/fmu family ribosome biogenesis protein
MKNELVPEHELALASGIILPFPKILLTKEQALRYLKKEDVEIAAENKGWNIVCYNGVNLGFIKHLGNRYNNYYPKNWRIRMEIE